jgi:hypothetical protein
VAKDRVSGVLTILTVLLAATLTAQQAKPVPLESIAPLDLARLLDSYAAGRFDGAVREVAQANDEIGRRLRRHWSVTGRAWIDADPADWPRRALVAASLALESEAVLVERGDWAVAGNPPCAGPCVLDWAQLQIVERGAPDAAERAWYLAAASLASGVRDWRYLQRTMTAAQQATLLPGLMDRALVRFPGDIALRLEHALAAASRFSIVIDGAAPPLGPAPSIVGLGPGRGRAMAPPRPTPQEIAADLLASLADDPHVGAEARLRLGYLRWALGHHDIARAELAGATREARDPDLRYLAEFLLGWTAIARGDAATARPHLEAALAIRPASQSPAVALAAIELQRGEAARAHDIARITEERRPNDVDPWRLFLYGHHAQLSARIAALRQQVHR